MSVLTAVMSAPLRIALAALGFRIASAILALCIVLVFPLDHPIPDQSTMWGRPSPFWDTFVRHDSGWYFDIARTLGPNGFGRKMELVSVTTSWPLRSRRSVM